MKSILLSSLTLLLFACFALPVQAQPPPPPARGVTREDLPARPSCGTIRITRVHGEYERTVIADLACPRLYEVVPRHAQPGQWITIRGNAFGDSATRIGSDPGEKRLLLMPTAESGVNANPTPIRLWVARWSSNQLEARIPADLEAGSYVLGIFYPLLPGSHIGFGLVSNMVRISVSE